MGSRYDLWVAAGPIMLANATNRTHWSQRHKQTRAWREAAAIEAYQRQVPKGLPGCIIKSRAHYPTNKRGKLPDTTAWFPTMKAIVDGLVDYGCWPDDDGTWILGEQYFPAVRSDVAVATMRVQIEVIGDPNGSN